MTTIEIDTIERRTSPRVQLSPMHSPVTIQHVEDLSLSNLEGHAYDISETGVRLEIDIPVEVGSTLALNMGLPGQTTDMFVAGKVVWINDEEDDPGPRRLAMRFTDFLSNGDKTRLTTFLDNETERIAA